MSLFESSGLALGGIVPLSCSDFPDALSAVLFCRGCPLRCRYCQNPHLQNFGPNEVNLARLYEFLLSRCGLLDAVVFSGGEPTYQKGLQNALVAVRELGFKIGLHTAAPSLKCLERIIPYLDWVGLDVKALPGDYSAITGVLNSGNEVIAAIASLLAAGVEVEVRTTVHQRLINKEQLHELASMLANMGVSNYAVQVFRAKGCLDPELKQSLAGFENAAMSEIACLFKKFTLRTA